MSQQPNPLEQIQQLWMQLSSSERETHLEWTLNHCAPPAGTKVSGKVAQYGDIGATPVVNPGVTKASCV
jgi:hypothetical protein